MKEYGVIAIRFHQNAQTISFELQRLTELMIEDIAQTVARVQLSLQLENSRVVAETEKLRSALLSSVSHDLRSPLAAMIGSAMQRLKHYQPEVKIEVALAEELPQLYVHPALIEQAISNVLRHEEDTHYLRILVKKLRSKIGDSAVTPKYIFTIAGVGLRFQGQS